MSDYEIELELEGTALEQSEIGLIARLVRSPSSLSQQRIMLIWLHLLQNSVITLLLLSIGVAISLQSLFSCRSPTSGGFHSPIDTVSRELAAHLTNSFIERKQE